MSKVLIKYTKPNLYRIGDEFRLLPGMNEVKAEVWDNVKANPGVKARIERGDIVVKSAPSPVASTKAKATSPVSVEVEKEEIAKPSDDNVLSEFNAKDACAIVSETNDVETLKRWQGIDTRRKVLAAIEKQLQIFAPPKKDDEGAKKNATDKE